MGVMGENWRWRAAPGSGGGGRQEEVGPEDPADSLGILVRDAVGRAAPLKDRAERLGSPPHLAGVDLEPQAELPNSRSHWLWSPVC